MIEFVDNLVEKVKHGVAISLGEGFEWVRRRKTHLKEVRHRQDHFKEFPTESTEIKLDSEEQKKYLRYALSLIQRENKLYWHLLMMRMQGLSCKQISKQLTTRLKYNITVAEVSKKEAVRCVKQTIDRVIKTGIPIFGEPRKRSPILSPN